MYDPKNIEKKWQEKWEKEGLFKTPEKVSKKDKMYILPQLPYPSGSGLHVGHAEVYTACDIYARYQRMIGKKVLQVIGWDSFGLPAENYAIKTNVHPKEKTAESIDNFRNQIKSLGISVDWDREVGSHNPDYYKFTQWFFLLMYERGLAYRKNQSVNWCGSCKTVLANEQVTPEGVCERCETEVVQKEMEQWYLKITDYAQRLLDDLEKIDWPEETKKRQKDWIGRSDGARVSFAIKDSQEVIEVFTTAHDTIYGTTFMVLAPEHALVQSLKDQISNWKEVEKYILKTTKKTELERQQEKEKTGVALEGVVAINPVNGKEIPVWIADYVLATYGTGSIMAVPGADERDYEFAKKFNLEVVPVVKSDEEFVSYADIKGDRKAYMLINSEEFDGQDYEKGRAGILKKIEKGGYGNAEVQFKLRDWSVSRQRFWGAPVPMLLNESAKRPKVLLIHGYGGHDQENWFPWFKREMEQCGYDVLIPNLPNTDRPELQEWVDALLALDISEDDGLYVVGHSLGGPTACHFLKQSGLKAKKLILTAPVGVTKSWEHLLKFDGFDEDAIKRIEAFAGEKIGLSALRKHIDGVTLFFSKDDPYIPSDVVDHYAPLKGDVRTYEDMGHFNARSGILEFADILSEFPEVTSAQLKPVPFEDLPVVLPDDVDFKPTGQSPLTYSEDFQKGVEKKYGEGWRREVDTLDTFMCSSWYFFRYLDPKNEEEFASKESLKKWMPVDFYLGGEEHVNGHLLYSRFFTKVLFDAGYIDFDEPFTKHRHQGLILGEDSKKMSKRWGNVINPSDVVDSWGADTCRMYEMFMGPLEDTKPWSTDGVKGVRRFCDRLFDYFEKLRESMGENFELWKKGEYLSESHPDFEKLLHKSIKKIGEDCDNLKFNTAIAQLMIVRKNLDAKTSISYNDTLSIIKLLAPFAPHMAEELWEIFGGEGFVSVADWPVYDESKITDDVVKLAVQVNGKLRATIELSVDASDDEVKEQALTEKNVQKWLDGKKPKKVIIIKHKIVSIVV